MKTYQLIVEGRVQRVNFRDYVMSVAVMLDYVGYVRNLIDGTVEVMVNALYEEDLEFFISKLYEGSMYSKVANITYQEVDYCFFDNFERRG